MPVVGLTGGIASGKSTVATLLRRKGAEVIDADSIARRVVEPGTQALEEIRRRFGAGVVREDGTLDREKLGTLVFTDPAALESLNALLHPLIFAEIRSRLAASPSRIRIVEAALLVESAPWDTGELDLDALIVVEAPAELRKRRLAARRGMSEEDAAARMAAQADAARRRAQADYVIENAGSLEELGAAVDDLWDRLVARFAPR